MAISQDLINGVKLSLDIFAEMQKTIYGYSNSKTAISVKDLKKGGEERLSKDMFNFIAKLKSVVANTEPLIVAIAENNVEYKKMQANNDKLNEYSDIYSKLEEGFQDWKKEIQEQHEGKDFVVTVPDLKEELQKYVPDVMKSVAEETVKTKKFQQPDCNTTSTMLKEELQMIQPVIRATVEDAVRRAIPTTVCSKTDVKELVQSYAEITQSSQRKS